MNYPSSLPSPQTSGFKIKIPFAVSIFRGGGKPKRRPIPQMLQSAEITFFLSQEQLKEFNEFYYNSLKNGTLEFIVDWEMFTKVKFTGFPKIKPVGNRYYLINIGIISTINITGGIIDVIDGCGVLPHNIPHKLGVNDYDILPHKIPHKLPTVWRCKK